MNTSTFNSKNDTITYTRENSSIQKDFKGMSSSSNPNFKDTVISNSHI